MPEQLSEAARTGLAVRERLRPCHTLIATRTFVTHPLAERGLERAKRGCFGECDPLQARLQSVRRLGTLLRHCNATPPGSRIATGELGSRDGVQCARSVGACSTLPRVRRE